MEKWKRADFLKLSEEIMDQGACLRFRAKGFSMRPFIQNGDFITVSPVKNFSIRIGDIVLYAMAESRLIVHRVIKKYKKNGSQAFLVKGDAAFGCPEQIDIQNVLGKVVAIERNGRKRILNSRLYKMLNFLLAGISPFNQWIYPIGGKIKQTAKRYGNFRRVE